MDKIKKIWKELSVFGVVLVCILGLYIYRLIVTVDIPTVSGVKVVSMIENDKSFVLYTGKESVANTSVYATTIETYLKKNRSDKIYYLDTEKLDEAEAFVKKYFGEEGVDSTNPHTYVFINGDLTTKYTSALGYYDLDKLMNSFNETK